MYSAISDHHQNYRSWVIAVEYELRSGHSITFGLGVMSAPTAAARLANFCWCNYRHEFGFKVGTPKTGRLIPKTAKLSRKFWAIFAIWHFEIHDSLSLLIQLISKLSSPRSGRCGRCCCCRTAGCSTTGATGTGCCAGPGGCQADGEGGTAGGWAGGGVGHAWSGAPSDGDGFKRCGEWVYSDMLWVGVESPFELPPIREDGDPTFLGNFPVPKASWVIFFSFDMHQKVPIHWGTPPFREELVRSMRNPQ